MWIKIRFDKIFRIYVFVFFQVARALVSPTNQGNVTASCQKIMNQCGFLRELCEVLMSGGVPADVLTETINTVAEIIRGCLPNQEYFNAVVAPSEPPRLNLKKNFFVGFDF